jgi:hypothetical protein
MDIIHTESKQSLSLFQFLNTMKKKYPFIVSIFYTAIFIAFLKIAVGYYFVEKGRDIGKAEAWLRYVYYVKEHLAREQLNIPASKIIIVAGSGSLFGVDNTILSQITQRPVINMATHAGLSFDYHMGKVIPFVKTGDIVVMPLEFTYYSEDLTKSKWMQFNMLSWDKGYARKMPLSKQLLWIWWSPEIFVRNQIRNLIKPKKYRLMTEDETISKWEIEVSSATTKASEYSFKLLRADGTFQPPEMSTYKGMPNYIASISPTSIDEISFYAKMIGAKGAQVVLTCPAFIDVEKSPEDKIKMQIRLLDLKTRLAANGLNLHGEFVDVCLPRTSFSDNEYHLTTAGQRHWSATLGRIINNVTDAK